MAQDPEWVELYDYVHDKILGYDKTIKLPKYMILRLQGLKNGQFLGNNKQTKNAKYDYRTILITFKYCRQNILNGFKNNEGNFKDENHKFNYLMTIVDKEINNVAIKLKNFKKAEEKTVNIELGNQVHDTADYKPKSKEVNKKLEELW